MTTKEIVLQVIDAFDNNDVDKILDLFADDVIWTMKGSNLTISNGKDEVEKFLSGMEDVKVVSSTYDHLIVDGNKAAVDGFIQCKNKNSEEINMHYADFYELENDRVKILTSYIVDKKD
ncbi:Ketosteroid isomerase-related protein [Mucilaginibacter lappiensis]|uniref:Ketosteroid isomerase-like protein n=1 Tax=Mucilaginibacter lappiensis TaxID=354630 RepID=A0ABR6PMJ1_9SPHI|nr:nuclear transport factor 2 family protein [Mucilaginibacter lappiensis]MBB6110826.1 ketosteroid isomerase-like protein [Mucilaginibacter lappiensis]SIR62689.1 Ketosteroid isomerase-related protein [Mucilaginibacter lappiensis]